jgi:DNA topoisomerase-1
MARRGGWKRLGSRGRFRYEDSRGRRITDETHLARIESLAIPPAWRDVWISPRLGAKLQATGIDKAGRRQYLYHPEYRARQEQAKYDKLVSFAEKLPDLRQTMAEHMEQEPLSFEWTAAVAVRLINLGWFRVGDERYAKKFRTFGITTLRKSHVRLHGSRVAFRFRAKHRVLVHTALVDSELAGAMKELLAARGGRTLFRYRHNGDELVGLSARRLNDYIQEHMGEDFTAKDFRTWGGTLLAAVALAEGEPAETEAEQKRAIAAVMRAVGKQLGNTPAVARASYVSPAVVEQYLDGRTIDDFRPRHLRVVGARDMGLDLEEQSLLGLLRSWRIRRAREAA